MRERGNFEIQERQERERVDGKLGTRNIEKNRHTHTKKERLQGWAQPLFGNCMANGLSVTLHGVEAGIELTNYTPHCFQIARIKLFDEPIIQIQIFL